MWVSDFGKKVREFGEKISKFGSRNVACHVVAGKRGLDAEKENSQRWRLVSVRSEALSSAEVGGFESS